MAIPVFVSCPTSLSDIQQKSKALVFEELERFGLEGRTLGQTDYPTEFPLREVLVIARHCSGGLILGFEQMRADSGEERPNTERTREISAPLSLPTPWNHLEAGIMFSLGLPMLVFREPRISGGVFDYGVTDLFIHTMPTVAMTDGQRRNLQAVFLKWQAKVRDFYYR